MKMLFAGGVTGGHIAPGVALAEHVMGNNPGWQVLFAGVANEVEERMITRRGLHLTRITGRTRSAAQTVVSLPAAFLRARRLLAWYRPDVVVGLGGNASLGAAFAALSLKKPLVLLEQNRIPGRANRLLAGRASRVFCQWQEAAAQLGGNAMHSGSPVRKEIGQSRHVDRAAVRRFFGLDPARPTLLVMGGSQGSRSINQALMAAAPGLAGRAQVIHLAGPDDRDAILHAYREADLAAHVTSFFETMHLAYGAADLALSRAGATSIAEFAVAGLPAILVPYPYARDDHQRANAEDVVAHGWGLLLDQRELTADRVVELVTGVLGDEERGRAMAENARRAAREEAADIIFESIYQLVAPAAEPAPVEAD